MPETLRTTGDAARAIRLATALVRQLRPHAAVRRAYSEWRAAHQITGRPPIPPAAWDHVRQSRDADIVSITALVDRLHLAWADEWLPAMLLTDFAARACGLRIEFEPTDNYGPSIRLTRRPPNDGHYLERDARWLLDVDVRRMTPYRIATRDHFDAKSVRDSIARSRQLLATLSTADLSADATASENARIS